MHMYAWMVCIIPISTSIAARFINQLNLPLSGSYTQMGQIRLHKASYHVWQISMAQQYRVYFACLYIRPDARKKRWHHKVQDPNFNKRPSVKPCVGGFGRESVFTFSFGGVSPEGPRGRWLGNPWWLLRLNVRAPPCAFACGGSRGEAWLKEGARAIGARRKRLAIYRNVCVCVCACLCLCLCLCWCACLYLGGI